MRFLPGFPRSSAPATEGPRRVRNPLGARLRALGLLLAGALLPLGADPPLVLRPAMRVLGSGSDLPNPTVYGMEQDALGRLWVGTQDGVAVFNGHHWTTVPLPQGAVSTFVRAVLCTKDGSQWFGTQDGGLWRLAKGQWAHYKGGEELPSNRIYSLCETFDAEGASHVWVGTSEGVGELSHGKWARHTTATGALPGNWVWKIRELRAPGQPPALWACTRGGLARFSQGTWTKITPQEGLPGPEVNDVAFVQEADGEGVLWAGIWQRGVARLRRGRWELAGDADQTGLFPVCLGTTVGPDREMVLWVGTFDRGLAWLRKGRWHGLGGSQGLASNGVYTLFPVPGGKPTLLFGTRGGGLHALDMGGWSTVDAASGLPGTEATAFLETRDPQGRSETWVGTNQGLALWRAGRWERVSLGASSGGDFINGLAETGRGSDRTLWVATLKGLAHRRGGAWTFEDTSRGLPNNFVLSLLPGHPESGGPLLWAGTQGGLASLRNGRWSLITDQEGLPHNWVYSLLETQDPDGGWSLWVGTRGGGVGRLKEGRWTIPDRGLDQRNLSVYCLRKVVSQDGRPWLFATTVGRGLLRLALDRPEAAWDIFTPDNVPGLPGKVILRLEELGGRLYATTSRGVARITLSPGGAPIACETATTGDGLPTTSCTPTASYIDGQQRLWVGTQQGAAILDSDLESPPPPPRLPVVDSWEAGDRPRPVTSGQTLLHTEANVALHLAFPVFYRWEDTRFQTQLVGLEAHPGPWTPESVRRFPSLPAGPHLIRIWCRDAHGRITGPAEFAFRILPAPWASPLAKAAYLLALLGLGYLSVRLRTRMLQRRNEALSRRVEEATRDLQRQHRELESLHESLKKLATEKDQFLSMVTHDLRNPISTLSLHVEMLGMGLASPEELERTAASMDRTLHQMSDLLARLMDLRAMESGKIQMDPAPLDLRDIAQLAADDQAMNASRKGMHLKLELPPAPVMVHADPTYLEQAVINLISNAIKFSLQELDSAVTVRVRTAAGFGLLDVADQGPGFTESDKGAVFQQFSKLSARPTGGESSSGLGLSIVKRLVEIMGGRVELQSEQGQGAQFTLVFPLHAPGSGSPS